MPKQVDCEVAVLLATYNGVCYVESQIRSLRANRTRFTLHWLDDHSTDDTRQVVRATASGLRIKLQEWHQPQPLRIPGVFFKLLECVEADFYFFCDQDDIWQPGKIDAAVASLAPDRGRPVLCYTDSLVFREEEPSHLQRLTELRKVRCDLALEESRIFTYHPATGHTNGFTRPLRDLFLRHKDIARNHTHGHDYWMYLIAHAAGSVRMLPNAPTTMYRLHGNNAFGMSFVRRRKLVEHVRYMWEFHQLSRRRYARQATGFILASKTLPPGPRLDRLVALAQLVSRLDSRHSMSSLSRLVRLRILPPIRERAFWFIITCLLSDARR